MLKLGLKTQRQPNCSQVRVMLDAIGITEETVVRACEEHARRAVRSFNQGNLDSYENERTLIAQFIRKSPKNTEDR